jgi:hypothetical protein
MDQGKGKSFPRDTREAEQKQPKKANRRWTAIAAQMLIVPFLLFFSLMIGLIIGYSVIGDQPASEVFDLKTYKHMYDLIFSGT